MAWHRSVNDDTDVCRLLQVISCSPLKTLRLSPPNSHFDFPRELPITWLGLRYEGYHTFDDGRYLEDLRHLGDLCGISSLTYLSIDGWHDLAIYSLYTLYPLLTKTSNVSHMFFWDNGPPGPGFQQVISLPKALRSLSYEAVPNFSRDSNVFSGVLSSGDLHYALQNQFQSLEALCIFGMDRMDVDIGMDTTPGASTLL